MSELDELRDALAGTRIVMKGTMRTMRSALGVLTDLEERIAALDIAQPEEAQRNEHDRNERTRRDSGPAAADARTAAAA